MKAQVNLSQVLQGGLAALVGWLFKTVNDLQQEVAVLMVQITDAKDDLISLAMREQELNSAITEILIKLGGLMNPVKQAALFLFIWIYILIGCHVN